MFKKCLLLLSLALGSACSNNSSMSGTDLGVSNPDLLMMPPNPDLTAPKQLSLQAQRGFTLSPVTIDKTNLSIDQQEMVGTGAYLVAALNCGNCHGATATAFLSGGRSFTVGASTVYARNLTSDSTTGMKLSQANFIEVMRTGKDFVDNGALLNMPYTTYRWMTTYDLQAIYAYLKAIPAVMNAVTADAKAAPGTPTAAPTAYADGDVSRMLPPDNTVDPIGAVRGLALQALADPPNFNLFSDTAKQQFGRGAYLVTLINCNNCHTNPSMVGAKINTANFLSGGRVFLTAAAMQPTLKTVRTMSVDFTGQQHGFDLSQDDFVKTLTTHTHADETPARPLGSPMPDYKNLIDDDMIAIYTYLTAIPRRTGTGDKATQDYARYCAMDSDCNMAGGETCNLTTKECVGKACTVDGDCDACQTCGPLMTCLAPLATSMCLTNGI